MTSNNKTKVEYWLELAEYDVVTAEVMLKGKRYLYVGFMCHQVVEKALKACTWALRDVEPEYTHSLARLLRNSGIPTPVPECYIGLVDVLEPLNIEARYPTQKEKLMASLTDTRSTFILNQTKEFYQWIKAMF